MEMKISDYIAQKSVELGIAHVFMVTGGGAMHLNHSFGTHPDISCTFNHHEQACAIAAEAYYRLTNQLAIVNVTSGPGGTNAITGVYGAFVDSVGMLVISGQVKWETTVRSTGLPLRQYGDQELDIEQVVRPITKYCQMVVDPLSIRYHLEKACYLAKSGRPGPCWLDIPLNVQSAKINVNDLVGFDPAELDEPWLKTDLQLASKAILEKIVAAKRPVIFAGFGIRLSGQHQAFLELIDKLGIPVVTGFNGHDALWDNHPLYVGRPGTIGDRPGNFATQNADLLIVLGSRLNIRQVSYNWNAFAREAFKIWIDIDENELKKPNVSPNLGIHANLKDLLPLLAGQSYCGPVPAHQEWLTWCLERRDKFPVVLPEYWNNSLINPYCFMQTLFETLQENQIVVTGNATACIVSFQAGAVKKGQRILSNSGCASMGYDLPAAIGAAAVSIENRANSEMPPSPVICLAGDGSIMMNLQELQTIAGNALPIKIFILNNSGYVSIFQTHRNFFAGVEVGAGPKSGVSFPEFSKISAAFGLPYVSCAKHEDMKGAIAACLAHSGPSVFEVFIDEHLGFAPKLSSKQHPDGRISSPPLEDLAPFLSREELKANMIIDLVKDD